MVYFFKKRKANLTGPLGQRLWSLAMHVIISLQSLTVPPRLSALPADAYPVFPTRQIRLSTMSLKGNDRDESAAILDLNANNETCATLILKFWFSCQLASRFV